MKFYKDPTNNDVYAYEADGSQDAFIKPGLVAITNQEADEIRVSKMPKVDPAPVIDPVTKLKDFLAANPDVAKLLG